MTAAVVWIVVTSKPGQESRAKRELEQQGFETYLPMRLAETRKGEMRASPFFPRYLFAHVPSDMKSWRCIFSTFGVAGVLGCSAARAVGLTDAAIQKVRQQEEDGYIKIGLAEDQARKGFGSGQRVREAGFGLEGAFHRAIDKDRAEILVEFMGHDSLFVVDLKTLRATEMDAA